MGRLTFTYACMGAGKTTQMLTMFDQYKRRKKKPVIIKPCMDVREGIFTGWGITKSRIAKNEEPTYYFKDLKTELDNLDFGVLFVDEAQFLTREDKNAFDYDYVGRLHLHGLGLATATRDVGVDRLLHALSGLQFAKLAAKKLPVYGVRMVEVMSSLLFVSEVARVLVVGILRDDHHFFILEFVLYGPYDSSFAAT